MLTRIAIELSAGSHGSAGFKIACKNMIQSNLKLLLFLEQTLFPISNIKRPGVVNGRD